MCLPDKFNDCTCSNYLILLSYFGVCFFSLFFSCSYLCMHYVAMLLFNSTSSLSFPFSVSFARPAKMHYRCFIALFRLKFSQSFSLFCSVRFFFAFFISRLLFIDHLIVCTKSFFLRFCCLDLNGWQVRSPHTYSVRHVLNVIMWICENFKSIFIYYWRWAGQRMDNNNVDKKEIKKTKD